MTEVNIIARGGHPDFLDLPWGEPLARWDHPRLVKMAHGISRHVVRFVRYGDRVYALKETAARPAQAEYGVLRDLRDHHLPVVEPVGVVSGLPVGDVSGLPMVDVSGLPMVDVSGLPMVDGATLITRYLDFSLPYWYLLGRGEPALADRLLDAGVVLLVRLHLENVFWGDCSLSNILFRRDAGALMAYMVDAETTERTESIAPGMRLHDLAIAQENVIGGLLDLQAERRVPSDIDPFAIAEELRARYERLWDELTRPEEFDLDERWRIERRFRQVNDLGFDVEELSISSDGRALRIRPVLIEEGHHARELRRRTGLEVQENQARRLLADIASHQAWLERQAGKPIPAAVAAARWLADVYEPVVESIPDDLQATLEPAEIFHHLLEHRYYMSEARQSEVSHSEALADYIGGFLARQPAEKQLEAAAPAEDHEPTDG